MKASLRVKLFITLSALLTAVLAAVCAVSYIRLRNDIYDRASLTSASLADSLQKNLQNNFGNLVNKISIATGHVAAKYGDYAGAADVYERTKALQVLESELNQMRFSEPAFSAVCLIEADGGCPVRCETFGYDPKRLLTAAEGEVGQPQLLLANLPLLNDPAHSGILPCVVRQQGFTLAVFIDLAAKLEALFSGPVLLYGPETSLGGGSGGPSYAELVDLCGRPQQKSNLRYREYVVSLKRLEGYTLICASPQRDFLVTWSGADRLIWPLTLGIWGCGAAFGLDGGGQPGTPFTQARRLAARQRGFLSPAPSRHRSGENRPGPPLPRPSHGRAAAPAV